MSRFERRYSWKHVVVIVALFVVAGSVNVIPRSRTLIIPCKSNPNVTVSTKETRWGWPLTYSTTQQPKTVCLEFKKGRLVGSLTPKMTKTLNVWALIANEALVVVVIGSALALLSIRKANHE